jgi:hypothetical protein
VAINEERRFGPIDLDLLILRSNLTPGQRIQSMLNTREFLVGQIRGRLRQQYPDLSPRELNLKVLEEIESAKQTRRP